MQPDLLRRNLQLPDDALSDLPKPIRWRRIAEPGDRARIADLLQATGGYTDEDIAAATAMVATTLSGADTYRFLFAEDRAGTLLGYTCHDRAPQSAISWELYGIAVLPRLARTALPGQLIERTDEMARKKRARQVFVELSSREAFARARAFYENSGFVEMARFADFYQEGEDKLVLRKSL